MEEKAPLLGQLPGAHRRSVDSDDSLSYSGDHRGRTSTVDSILRSGHYTTLQEEEAPDEMLDQAIEGLEYDMTQNDIFIDEMEQNAKHRSISIEIWRYTILFLIGVTTGLAAFTFDVCIEYLAHWKFSLVGPLIESSRHGPVLALPGFLWCVLNAALTLVAALMVVYFAPVAAGSGIPQIKCYLNGINVPFVMRGVTMLTKGVGVVLAVAGGLAVGKEGPMIHTGAAIAAGISQGRFTWLKWSFRSFRSFRNDQEKRDFVSAGAAAGVAAAFGAPVGGLLFCLEEGTSFVNQKLTWKILFSSIVSMFTLSLFNSIMSGNPLTFKQGGLISFGTFDNLNSYSSYEIALFCSMGVVGGLSGALFNKLNVILTNFRKKNINAPLTKAFEAALVAFVTAAAGFTIISYIQDCQPIHDTSFENPLQMFCSDSEYNAVSSLFFQTPEKSLRSLLHDPQGTYQLTSLLVFAFVYFILAFYTYGLSVPSGLFIPCLLLGASWGRLIGIVMYQVSPDKFPDPGKFALIGAAAQLGGVVRMTVSLTVILMEATGNIIVGLPLVITLVVAKYVGDLFTEGIYDMHIDLSGYALLPWEPDGLSVTKRAFEVMSSPVVALDPVMSVRDLIQRIGKDPHNAFPVVEGPASPSEHRYGTLVGLISRQHLALLIRERIFYEDAETQPITSSLTYKHYDDTYPRFPQIRDVVRELAREEKDLFIDVRPYMNQAPYSVPETMTMNRVFYLFRLLGLRHLPVVDLENQVRGLITRKDLRRFRFEQKDGVVHTVELLFSRQI